MKQILNRQEIEDVLRKYIRTKEGALLDCRISGFEPFKELYGPAASDEVLHFTERLIEDVLTEVGTPNDRLGEPEVNNFVIITTATAMPRIRERLQSRFNNEVLAFYSLHDRERGYLIVNDHSNNEIHESLMRLGIGALTMDEFLHR